MNRPKKKKNQCISIAIEDYAVLDGIKGFV